jgi:hypothetical protein
MAIGALIIVKVIVKIRCRRFTACSGAKKAAPTRPSGRIGAASTKSDHDHAVIPVDHSVKG